MGSASHGHVLSVVSQERTVPMAELPSPRAPPSCPGAYNFRDRQGRRDFTGSNDAPGDQEEWEWRRKSAHVESAISRLRPTSERRAITTAITTPVPPQNGTSELIAGRGPDEQVAYVRSAERGQSHGPSSATIPSLRRLVRSSDQSPGYPSGNPATDGRGGSHRESARR